jgi:DNA repair protein RadA
LNLKGVYVGEILMSDTYDTEEQTEFDLTSLPGIGKSNAAKLKSNGLNSVAAVANASVDNISALTGLGLKRSEKIIKAAKDYLGGSYITAIDGSMFDSMTDEPLLDDEDKTAVSNEISHPAPIMSISDMPGVGPSTAKKLEEAGYSTVMALAVASITDLAAVAGMGEKTAAKLIQAAHDSMNITFETAASVLTRRLSVIRLTTSSEALDELFGGGIESSGITEFAGEYRTGKTQLAHQLCVNVFLPVEQGGFRKPGQPPPRVIYIDTEGTFRPERIAHMISAYPELDREEVLTSIQVARAYNSDHQIVLADQVFREGQDHSKGRIALLVVDSLTSHFRAEYVGRGTLASRQQKLNKHIHSLLRIGEVLNIPVIVTNQVHAKPDMFFGDPNVPIGGHVVAHACTTRVYLRKGKGARRIIRILDSPVLPESESLFVISEAGIRDA